eukprot:Nk52_evm21s248 gene=Nk52_evmTU21s248
MEDKTLSFSAWRPTGELSERGAPSSLWNGDTLHFEVPGPTGSNDNHTNYTNFHHSHGNQTNSDTCSSSENDNQLQSSLTGLQWLSTFSPSVESIKSFTLNGPCPNGNMGVGGNGFTRAIHYQVDPNAKPALSYASLIAQAIHSTSDKKQTLNGIYEWIRQNYPFYKSKDTSWQNSVRHNLSLNKCFTKVPRTAQEPGKGGFWMIDPEYANLFVNGILQKKRRRSSKTEIPGAISMGKVQLKSINNNKDQLDAEEKKMRNRRGEGKDKIKRQSEEKPEIKGPPAKVLKSKKKPRNRSKNAANSNPGKVAEDKSTIVSKPQKVTKSKSECNEKEQELKTKAKAIGNEAKVNMQKPKVVEQKDSVKKEKRSDFCEWAVGVAPSSQQSSSTRDCQNLCLENKISSYESPTLHTSKRSSIANNAEFQMDCFDVKGYEGSISGPLGMGLKKGPQYPQQGNIGCKPDFTMDFSTGFMNGFLPEDFGLQKEPITGPLSQEKLWNGPGPSKDKSQGTHKVSSQYSVAKGKGKLPHSEAKAQLVDIDEIPHHADFFDFLDVGDVSSFISSL